MLLQSLKPIFVTAMLLVSSITMAQSNEFSISASRMVGSVGAGLVQGLPYTLREKITTAHVLADGSTMNNIREEHQMRDSAGRVRTEVGHLEDGKLVVDSVQIRDEAARTIAYLSPRDSSARVVRLKGPVAPPPAEHLSLTNSADKSTTVEKLPSQTLAGMKAEGIRSTRVIPERAEGNEREVTVVTENWRSPELKIGLQMTLEDPRKDKRTEEAIDLQRVEPDPALFQIPADFTVVDE